MKLTKENENDDSASFLDLNIKIQSDKFSYGLYDKRDSFPFSIVRMPHVCSNMPAFIFYSCFAAEILRIARASSCPENFIIASRTIIKRAIKQGAILNRLKKSLAKSFESHLDTYSNFANQSHLFLSILFD